jgi:hypothetical protein
MFETKALHAIRAAPRYYTYNFNLKEHRKFVMLNARPRPPRIMLSYLLYANNLLDKGYCSVPAESGNVVEPYNFHEIIKIEENRGFDNVDYNLVKQMQAQLPFKLDNIDYHNSLELNDSIYSDIFQIVDFALITETFSEEYHGKVFITEKIIKAITNRIPFIVLGDRDTLKYLRELGYKTFGFVIDESYDALPYVERVNAIVAEVKRLCDVDFAAFKDQIAEVTEHNFNVLSDNENYRSRIERIINFLNCPDLD